MCGESAGVLSSLFVAHPPFRDYIPHARSVLFCFAATGLMLSLVYFKSSYAGGLKPTNTSNSFQSPTVSCSSLTSLHPWSIRTVMKTLANCSFRPVSPSLARMRVTPSGILTDAENGSIGTVTTTFQPAFSKNHFIEPAACSASASWMDTNMIFVPANFFSSSIFDFPSGRPRIASTLGESSFSNCKFRCRSFSVDWLASLSSEFWISESCLARLKAMVWNVTRTVAAKAANIMAATMAQFQKSTFSLRRWAAEVRAGISDTFTSLQEVLLGCVIVLQIILFGYALVKLINKRRVARPLAFDLAGAPCLRSVQAWGF